MPTPWHYTTFLDFLDHWQTLIAGALAITAAIVGAYFVNEQIRESRKQETDRIGRRHVAARAVLPLSLSYLCAYERDNAAALRKLYQQRVGEMIPENVDIPSFPDMPSEIVAQFTETIESGGEAIQKAIATLLAQLQVQSARLEGLKSWPKNRENRILIVANIEDYILDAAEICARASALFEFARRESETATHIIDNSQVTSALNQLGFLGGNNQLFDRARRRQLA